MKSSRRLRNEKGQATIEGMLILVVLFGVVQLVSKKFTDAGLVREYIQKPWQTRIAGMIENGAWGTPEETNALHPNRLARHSSIVGTEVQ